MITPQCTCGEPDCDDCNPPKRGRPKVADSKRLKIRSFRMSDEDWEFVGQIAYERDIPRERLIREAAMKEARRLCGRRGKDLSGKVAQSLRKVRDDVDPARG